MKCDVRTATKPPTPLKKVAPPKPYVFNHEVGVDAVEVKDAAEMFYDILNIIDYGTTMQQAGIVRAGEHNGVPSSANCLDFCYRGWVRPYGWPRYVAVDRGAHNRGVFAQTLAKNGVRVNLAALESPEQVGRVERRNATFKHILDKVIKETNAIGREQVDMPHRMRNGHQRNVETWWILTCPMVLARFPRKTATLGDEEERFDIGALQGSQDGPTAFAIQRKYRQEAREAFVKWDCGSRVQRGI